MGSPYGTGKLLHVGSADMNLDEFYRRWDEITDEQLLAEGLSARIIELAKQWYLRDGEVDMDLGYANAVWEAQGRVDVMKLSLLHPGEPVSIGWMGIVPDGWVREK